MKPLPLLLLSAALLPLPLLFAAPAAPAAGPRITQNFDASWKFYNVTDPAKIADPAFNGTDAERADYVDTPWNVVDVPHDWSIAGPYLPPDTGNYVNTMVGGGFLPGGVSWYRKTFELPASYEGKRVYIDFGGVMANSKVWINGQLLGERPYGYSSFRYDLTPHVKFGPNTKNVVVVRTDTTVQPMSRFYTGQGIVQHVRLVVTNPVHLQHWSVFVTTPKVSAEAASVNVQSAVTNDSAQPAQVAVQVNLVGPDGQVAATGQSAPQTIAPGQSANFSQDLNLTNPKLWDLDTPHLYQAVTQVVTAGNQTLDNETTAFGVRRVEFVPATGLWLNGKNVKIAGVCIHSDGGAVGMAVPARVWERRFQILKAMGVNGIRTAHNPPTPEFLDAADRLGMLVFEEAFDTWRAAKPRGERGYNLHFDKWWEADLTTMLVRDRNHPSIIIYSIGNEIRDPMNDENGPGRTALRNLRDLVHKLDPTRPVTMGLFGAGPNSPFLDELDIIGMNYRASTLPQLVRANPNRKTIDTEESHGLGNWRLVKNTPSTIGMYVWSGIDYLGETTEGGSWPLVISSNAREGFGLLDIDARKRPLAYQFEALFSPKPMLFLARSQGHAGTGPLVPDWTPADPGTYDLADVSAITNCEEVELFLNGNSLGTRPRGAMEGNPISWDQFGYEPGVIKAVGRNGGVEVISAELRTAGPPAKIALAPDKTKITNQFDDVAHIDVTVTDAQGVPNPNAEGAVTFTVTGPGKLVATSTGDRASHQPFPSATRNLYEGRMLAIVRATGDSGPITVTATAPGLPPASVTLEAAPAK